MGRFIGITANNWVDDGPMVNILTAPILDFYGYLGIIEEKYNFVSSVFELMNKVSLNYGDKGC